MSRKTLFSKGAAYAWAILFVAPLHAIADPPQTTVARRPAWTTSRIKGSPEPPLPYTAESAFPHLKFAQPVDVASASGSQRLFVAERSGKIYSFPNRPDVSVADLLVDGKVAIPGLADVFALEFHPDFARNRYCYICYIVGDRLPEGTHVARFRVTDEDPPKLDVDSELTVITWRSGGHNGCCLKFGPDGYLYISTGDAAPPNPPDEFKTGQDISDLASSILRIDVDHADDGKNYRIPADNPFVGVAGARGEVWAYGLRNPWRMSFDRKTGDLWVGDVGWELWEMLYRVERGGNYGWSVMEGRQPTNPDWPRGPTPILPPTIDHSHADSSSITDGLTYYGSRLPELYATHIYSDFDTGKFWGFRYVDGRVVDHRELADTSHRVVGFGQDPDGDFLFVDHTAGTLHRLVPNPQREQNSAFPRKLSDSGLFGSVVNHEPAPGVVGYSIIAEPWADHAIAERLAAIPGDLTIRTEGAPWVFPTDSVLAKTLSLETRQGDPSSRRRIETQILHFDGAEWMPYVYQWNDEESDAILVDASGAERTWEIVDASAPSGRRQQAWRHASRAECLRCHNKWSGPVLGFNRTQLDKPYADRGADSSQLDDLVQSGLISHRPAAVAAPQLVDPRDATAEPEARARSYLQANCAHCHRENAGGTVASYMHADLPLEKTNMVRTRPTQGHFGVHAAQVIAPGDPCRSVLVYRMAKLGGGRMPHIGSTEVDRQGVALMFDWIQSMPTSAEIDGELQPSVVRMRREAATSLERLRAPKEQTPASPEHAEIVDQLLSSTSGALLLLRTLNDNDLSSSLVTLVAERAALHSEQSVRDLFERWLPPERRVKRLGSVVQPEAILSLSGDLLRGKQLFWETSSVSCKNCHRIGQEGKAIGPELTAIGGKLSREQLLESILDPSRRIDPKFVTHLVETDAGRLMTGLLETENDQEIVLRDAQDNVVRIPVQQVVQLVPQQQSLMPDVLFRDMTAQQLADLLAYLSSLK